MSAKKRRRKINHRKEEEKSNTYKVKKVKRVKKEKKPKKKHRVLKWIRRIILAGIILGIILAIVAAGIIVGIFNSDKYKVSEDDLKLLTEKSKIVTQDGSLVTEIASDENRKEIPLSEMGEYIPKAFIAIEDERFYEHNGIDIKRTLGAVVKFITGKGSSSYGGSTITQQLIKNSFDDTDDTGAKGVERKIREMARAYNLEKMWSKDQILERYLNYIYLGGYGKNIKGVEMASEYYFSKSAKELSLSEAAYLAGINNTPNSYNPFDEEKDNKELIRKRTIDVLWKMKELGSITSEEEYNNAIQEVENGLAFKKGNIATRSSYSYHTVAVVNAVTSDLMEKYGWTYTLAQSKLEGGGYTVYSTVKPEIQSIMEEEFKKSKYIVKGTEYKKDEKGNYVKDENGNKILLNQGHTQAGMVVIDHATGYVVGCMGGLGEDADTTGQNRATQTYKQPGSSIKPIAVTAPALEKKIITAATVYDDSPTSFGSYVPHNASGYSGIISIRTALAESSNIVHVKIMRELGPSNSAKFLSTLGIDVPENHISLPLALGSPDVSPLQMAAAYAAIANGGTYIEPTFYTKVIDSEGNVILEKEQESRRVMSADNAYVLSNLLTAPVTSGTASVCAISGMDVAGKTGSTNSYKDRWLCGFTPYYAAATWYGFDYSEKPNVSSNNAANIWAGVMKPVHASLAKKRFQRTSNIVSAKICLDSGCSATEECTRTTTEIFVRGTVPKACAGHQKVTICKETGKVANEYCTDVEEKVFPMIPEKEQQNLWKTDSKVKETFEIPTEVCDVHKAPEQIEMINVVGKKLSEAKKLLEDKELKVEIEYKENKEKDDGIVLEQSVKEKEKVDVGSTIKLTVNKIEKEDEGTNTIVDTNTISGNTEAPGVQDTNTQNTQDSNTVGENEQAGGNTQSNEPDENKQEPSNP